MLNYIIIYYLLLNIVSFLIMGIDKNRAKRGEWRIREATLWWLAVIGGAIGGYIGMRVYHHKTKHVSFKFGFPILTIFHLLLFMYLLKQLA
ncbi:DUF1294 domain-containing protein [Metabacillus sediminilitoris]|uniref:DUF1294 domain-containing protein n=1 Tax=Metabacillus sediminilitoris TaxID=2567941 RepID=A0A4S4C4M5_9BACI|nr:DUF1294 domain-containing protein [Metabacillus sediminilitoris]THF82092.1 DUF1294 domain-containing protein [Metabacillus sediminilitoris]